VFDFEGLDMVGQLIQILVLCLAIASARWWLFDALHGTRAPRVGLAGRERVFSHAVVQLAAALWALTVSVHVLRDVRNAPHRDLQPLDWLAAAATLMAIVIHLWDRTARFPLRGLYLAGLTLIGMSLLHRDLSPGRFLIWTGICELTGFMLVTALLGWVLPQFPAIAAVLRVPDNAQRWSGKWFCYAQACLAAASVLLIGWILLDPAFHTLGKNTALFGLSGRLTSCPAALMLLGTTILMAWQTRAGWRAGWQYAALSAAVLFTSSIGWARLDTAAAAPWFRRGTYLLMSVSMMVLLTGFGLARVLPNSGDWVIRARRATPVFGGLALLLAAIALTRWVLVSLGYRW
jgi:hypothetical protein